MASGSARWVEQQRRRLFRENRSAARSALAEAKRARKERLRALRAECRERRRSEKERAKQARAELVQRHRDERDKLRAELGDARMALRSCGTDGREEARARVDAARERYELASREWARVRDEVRRHPRGLRHLSADERRAHERDEALAGIEREDERKLFRRLFDAGKIRATLRRSLGEAFAEWLHDHPEDLDELRNEEALKELARLEREAAERPTRSAPNVQRWLRSLPTLEQREGARDALSQMRTDRWTREGAERWLEAVPNESMLTDSARGFHAAVRWMLEARALPRESAYDF